MKNKKCSSCKKILNINRFSRNKSKKDKLHNQCKQCRKKYYISNRQNILKQRKKYQKKYYKTYLEYQKKYRQEHKEELLKKKAIYYLKNKQKILIKDLIYIRNKRKNDIAFRVLCNLRTRLNHLLRGKNKSLSTLNLIGCSIKQLKEHLQKQFTKGMTWDNYGKWHVDHIRPCASFDLSKEKEQIKCFNYINLRPLWALDNLKRPKIERRK